MSINSSSDISQISRLAIELMGQYVDVAIERWQAFTGETAKLEANGKTFAAIAAERKAS